MKHWLTRRFYHSCVKSAFVFTWNKNIILSRPVMIEVPHFGSLRGKEREIVILRSDNGETWREHTVDCSEEAVQDVLSHSFDKEGEFASTKCVVCFFFGVLLANWYEISVVTWLFGNSLVCVILAWLKCVNWSSWNLLCRYFIWRWNYFFVIRVSNSFSIYIADAFWLDWWVTPPDQCPGGFSGRQPPF